MRKLWIGIVAVLACLVLPGYGRAQATRAADGAGVHVEIGFRVGTLTGLTRTARHRLYGYEEPHWGEAELGRGGSIGGLLLVEPEALPIAFRATADWAFAAPLRVHTFGCGAGPETRCGPVDHEASSSRAFADLLWYVAPRDSRWRPFLAGGVGVTRFERESIQAPLILCAVPDGCPTDPFAGERIDPAVHGAVGVDFRLRRVRLSADAEVYGTVLDSADDRPASGWNTAAVLSLGARLRVR